MHYLIALGANLSSRLGSPKETLTHALWELAGKGYAVTAQSPWYATRAVPTGSGPDFVNGAVALRSERPPQRLLDDLQAIEAAFGRKRGERWGPRVIDLDLIACDDRVLPDREAYDHWRHLPAAAQRDRAPSELVLPHPRLQDRAFVLIPLADVAADWVHPVLGQSIAALLAALPADDRRAVRPLREEATP